MTIGKKTTLSVNNYHRATPKKLIPIINSLKSLTVLLAGSAYIQGKENLTFYIMIAGWALDETLKFIGDANS